MSSQILADPRDRRRFIGVVAIVLLVAGSLGVGIYVRRIVAGPLQPSDYVQDYLSARALLDGDPPYEDLRILHAQAFDDPVLAASYPPEQATTHPPAYVLLNVPFAALPYRAAHAGWILFTALALIVGMGSMARSLGASWEVTGAIVGGSLILPIVQEDLLYGQSNALMLALLVGAWIALKRGADPIAGIALGAAAALRLFPAFMIIPLLLARRWRAAAWMASTAVILTAAATAIVGVDATTDFALDASPWSLERWRAAPFNVSLPAYAFRYLTPSRWYPGHVNAEVLANVLAYAALLGCAAVALSLRRQRGTEDLFWAAVPWMVLASPIAWVHYIVLTLPALVWVVARRWRVGLGVPWWFAIVSAVLVVGFPPWVPSPDDVTTASQVLGFSLPSYALIAFGLWAWRGWGLQRRM